ncbi:MAG: zinc transporter [Desulfobacteraceae bacterium]|nr:zinc transporter [Desulfobacteraceae bacterium]
MTHDHAHDHSCDKHTHDHSCDKHAHSHSGSIHSHDHGKEMTMEQKLDTLFSHWIDHNESHRDNFLSWAKKARTAGLIDVALSLEQAGDLSREVTKNLEAALAKLPN